jgi:hypothetical protein
MVLIAAAPQLVAVSPPPDGGYPGGNTAEGQSALLTLTTGGFNTAVGFLSLRSNLTGQLNTAVGAGTLLANTADSNTAVGAGSLLSNTTGTQNTASGAFALFRNTTGTQNTVSGYEALFLNTTGGFNTAIGYETLFINTAGSFNTAVGSEVLANNTIGNDNTAVGFGALISNTEGSFNTAFGENALQSNTTGTNNTAIGFAAGANLTGNANVCIGSDVLGVTGEIGVTRIRNIGATPQDTGIYVTLDAVNGTKLGYFAASSSRRFKEEIKPMDNSSEALFALKPVSFRYKKEISPDRAERFGLIAEEVDKINPDLVSHDAQGEPLTVRYESINAMLLNEFLKEHREVEKLEATVADLAAQLRKVTVRLETSHSAAQLTVNNR